MGDPKAFLNIPRQEAGYRPVSERITDYSQVEQTLNTNSRKLQASRIVTGWSQDSFSTQDFSQRAGQIRPVNSGKSQVDDSTSYASFHFPLNKASCHSGCLLPIGQAQ